MTGRVVLCLVLSSPIAIPSLRASSAEMVSIRAARDVPPDPDPNSEFWRRAPSVVVENDQYGRPVPDHRTEVRSRWTSSNLYLLFICPYRVLYLKPDPKTSTETNQLWDWDVAESFIGSDFQNIRRYKEFEISPQGEWVDLDIDLANPHPEKGWIWNSGFQVSARIDQVAKVWYGVMRIPYSAIDNRPAAVGNKLRINLYRAQGPPPKRAMLTWRPTMSGSFHVPEHFGVIELVDHPK